MFREVPMVEVREVLRLCQMGYGLRRTSELLGMNRKTVRRYLAVAEMVGFRPESSEITDSLVTEVLVALQPGRPGGWHGEAWAALAGQHGLLKQWVEEGLRLTKIRVLLQRRGVVVPYRTLHRYCVLELGFGTHRETVRVDDGEPGQELQADFGRMGLLGRLGTARRLVKGLVLTAVVSRHMFCWLTFGESLEEVIEGFEEAWIFFGGVFRVVISDNLKAIVVKADPLHPVLNQGFLEYAQARGFVVDPCIIKSPTQKPRVERAVPYCRQAGFAGENFQDLAAGRAGMRRWCLEEAGTRIHGTTRRRPLEHFQQVELAHLLPVPRSRYEVPIYAHPKVARDHHISVGKALYSVPGGHLGEQVDVRADSRLVRISYHGVVLREHVRQAPGGRSTQPEDLPQEKRGYAMGDLEYLQRVAAGHGEPVGIYATQLLAGPLPWTRMRQVYRLLGLVKRYGAERVGQACAKTLALDVVDVVRVQRILEQALEQEREVAGGRKPPSAADVRQGSRALP
ncbi:MAG: IS21 family transposase [Candidatus Dormibacteraeota bacterium]|nr:IS21 family transposase [Candidatus Dormibacteraeota bacterium]